MLVETFSLIVRDYVIRSYAPSRCRGAWLPRQVTSREEAWRRKRWVSLAQLQELEGADVVAQMLKEGSVQETCK